MAIRDRIARLERGLDPPPAINPPRVEILVNVNNPDEQERERGADGIPTLSEDEAAWVKEGNTHCFIFSEPPIHVSFSPNGRGGIKPRAR